MLWLFYCRSGGWTVLCAWRCGEQLCDDVRYSGECQYLWFGIFMAAAHTLSGMYIQNIYSFIHIDLIQWCCSVHDFLRKLIFQPTLLFLVFFLVSVWKTTDCNKIIYIWTIIIVKFAKKFVLKVANENKHCGMIYDCCFALWITITHIPSLPPPHISSSLSAAL